MVSTSSTPGTSGWPGKWPSKTGLASGTVASASSRPSPTAVTRSIIWKVSRRIGGAGRRGGRRRRRGSGGAGGLGRHQLLDARREVLHDEVLLGRRRAAVHLLRPGLDRHLDAERLVDGEDDVEEVEAVDPEVVDDVAVGRDAIALHIARLGDDIGDAVERRGHGFTPGRAGGWRTGGAGLWRERSPLASRGGDPGGAGTGAARGWTEGVGALRQGRPQARSGDRPGHRRPRAGGGAPVRPAHAGPGATQPGTGPPRRRWSRPTADRGGANGAPRRSGRAGRRRPGAAPSGCRPAAPAAGLEPAGAPGAAP